MNKTFRNKKTFIAKVLHPCDHSTPCTGNTRNFRMWGDSIHWKYCKFQDMAALKDCKVLRGHASARQKVRGREGGREVEGRVMQDKTLAINVLCKCKFQS